MPTIGGEITVNDANTYINAFIANYVATGDFPVKSFIFDAELLRTYLDNNPDIENMKFMLGEKEFDVDGTPTNLPTLIITGYDSNGDYIKSSPGKVLDKSQPCPPKCPTVGNAASDNIS